MTKIIRHREVATLDLEDCTLDEMLEKFNSYKELHPNEVLKISFDGEYMQISGPDYMEVYFESIETDEEYNNRVLYEKEQIKEKELKEIRRIKNYKNPNSYNKQRLVELEEKYKNEQ